MPYRVDIDGIDKAQDFLERVQESAEALEKSRTGLAVTGRARLYSYGIEFGRRRSGRVARAAGGVFFVTGAVQAVSPRIDDELSQTFEKGPGATNRKLTEISQRLQVEAQTREIAVRSGNLRASIHAIAHGEGGLGRA